MTNWDKFKDSITPEIFGDLVSTENGEFSTCTYCPEGCRKLCKAHEEELEKMNDGEPYDEKLAFMFDCKDLFLEWANAEAKEEE